MMQAIRATRPGGHVGYVGVTHGDLPGDQLFFSHAHLHGGPAPVAASFPSSSTSSGTARSNPAGCSTSPFRSTKPPRVTGPWTNGAPSRPSSPSTEEPASGPNANRVRRPNRSPLSSCPPQHREHS